MSKRIVLGAAVKAIRQAKAQADPAYHGSTFAIACLTSHAHLCNVESGRKQPSADLLERLAAGLGVTLDAISYEVAEASAA